MFIKKIELDNFRNYNSVTVNLHDKINIFYGENASGKTNLLECIYVLGLTKSHRSFIDNNLIKEGSDFFRLKGLLKKSDMIYQLEVNNQKKKKIYIDNKEIKKVSDYISLMNIIIFYPEDLEIIKGSPILRRNFIDLDLSQLYSNYINILNEYNKLVKMRNERLKNNLVVSDNYLDILTDYMVDRAINIYKMRLKFINKINEFCPKIYKELTGNDNFYLVYKPCLEILDKEEYLNIFKQNYNREVKNGKTLFGPHLDDLEFYLDGVNLKLYGSQGQQRIAIIAVKLAEIEIFKNYKKENPILLLDDVFSELDIKKRNNLLKYIKNNIQTIITTTDLNSIDKKILSEAKIFEIKSGNIIEK